MGRRRLAYTVRKFNDGFYVLLTIAAEGKLITEIERRLRVSEPVIKFITVRMDEEEKRLAKVKAHRDTHVKRSTIQQSAQCIRSHPLLRPHRHRARPRLPPRAARTDRRSHSAPRERPLPPTLQPEATPAEAAAPASGAQSPTTRSTSLGRLLLSGPVTYPETSQ